MLEKRQEMTAVKLKYYKEKKMQDPEFVKAYEEIQPEMNVIRAMIEARTSQNLTQKELSERTGIAQTEISRLENGTRNPSIKLLQRLADGMGMVLNVTFTPKDTIAGVKKI
jgi:DNA-binding XRE family transcriptional regulator